jgi:hypothetical protein
MIHYLIQTLVFQVLFLACYDLFLRKETFFNWNRVYLLGTLLFSFLLPFIKFPGIRQQLPEVYSFELPAIIIESGASEASSTLADAGWGSWLTYTWLAGLFIAAGITALKLLKILRLKRKGELFRSEGFTLVRLPDSDAAFTFFRNVFMGELLGKAQSEAILRHEKVHVEQGHSWDLMLMELVRVVCWFNPLAYLYQRRMIELQEFTADALVSREQGRYAYYEHLLNSVFGTESISFINTFFNHSLIKKRIVMLQRSRSKKVYLLKYLLLIPLLASIVVYTSCAQETPVAEEPTSSDKVSELIAEIEAGGEVSPEDKLRLAKLLNEKLGENLHFDAKERVKFSENVVKGELRDQVTFMTLDMPPIFPGCEGQDANAARKCFMVKITEVIINNFDVDAIEAAGITTDQRMMVDFVVTETGEIKIGRIAAGHPELENQVRQAISQVPQLIPAQHQGKTVAAQLALPILYKI